MVIAGDIPPPDDLTRRLSAEDPEFSNNIVGFEWVADKTAFREWMHTLHRQASTHTIGWSETYKLAQSKVGVFYNLHKNAGLKAEEGWMPVVDGMRLVCEITQARGLDFMATLKAILDVRNYFEPQYWSFQILKVADAGWGDGQDRWFFRHSGDKKELQRRFLITNQKL